MKKYQVNVIGGKPPKRPHSFIRRLRGYAGRALVALPLRAGALVLAGSAGFASFIGTPHVGWEYQCGHATRGFGSCRSVSWCSYYGIQGRRVERPGYGERCKLVTLLPLEWNKLIERIGK